MKRLPRLTQEFTRTINPKLERFIRVNPTAVGLIRKKPSLGPQNGKWLKRASFISGVYTYGGLGLNLTLLNERARACSELDEGLTRHRHTYYNFGMSKYIYIYMYMYIYECIFRRS